MNEIITEDELTDMFGEGGKEEVKEAFGLTDEQFFEEKAKEAERLVREREKLAKKK